MPLCGKNVWEVKPQNNYTVSKEAWLSILKTRTYGGKPTCWVITVCVAYIQEEGLVE